MQVQGPSGPKNLGVAAGGGGEAPLLDDKTSRSEPPDFGLSLSRLSVRLLELDDEIVAFANRDVFVAVFFAHGQSGRQCPNSFRPVLCVARIGVDLRRSYQHESGLLGQGNRIILANVTALGLRILGHIVSPAMLFNSEDSARFQRRKTCSQRPLRIAVTHPIVKISK